MRTDSTKKRAGKLTFETVELLTAALQCPNCETTPGLMTLWHPLGDPLMTVCLGCDAVLMRWS